jgi:quercetin dioxygenase-like cupin family protein
MEVEDKRSTTKGPADWFTGEVYVDVVAQGHSETALSVGLVRFTPGARSAWHSHEIGQTLYVTEGEGRVQARGGPIVMIRAGDVVFSPKGEWHWHGSSPEHFMTHLAVTEGAAEWGDRVTDAEYNGESTSG